MVRFKEKMGYHCYNLEIKIQSSEFPTVRKRLGLQSVWAMVVHRRAGMPTVLDFSSRLFLVLGCVLGATLPTTGEPIRLTRETLRSCDIRVKGCCLPPSSNELPIVDFVPLSNSSKPLRVRKALQCLDGAELATYAEKLYRAYDLMRALPDDDPRSLHHQNAFHCMFGSGSTVQDGTSLAFYTHFTWLFGPWHRMFIYFHERLLQSLLGDPDFTLHFWNFDNSIEGTPNSNDDGCYKVGHHIPSLYTDLSKSTHHERSDIARDPTAIVDLSLFAPYSGRDYDHYENRRPDDELIASNRGIMHSTMVTLEDCIKFLGFRYTQGQFIPKKGHGNMIGTFERTHSSVHRWLGTSMFNVESGASDPLFYSYHAGVERLFDLWPRLRAGRSYPTNDPDWMDAEFLFYDEEKVMRRVKIRDSLSAEKLGYTFQKVNDESWIKLQANSSTDGSSDDRLKYPVGQLRLMKQKRSMDDAVEL